MTDKKDEALKLALEAFEADASNENFLVLKHCVREALAEQPAQQEEPVAWKDRTYGNLHHQDFGNSIPLYTSTPASKPWVGLSTEEMKEIADRYHLKPPNVPVAFRAIEAKLKERNT